jgi:hypothetical protein
VPVGHREEVLSKIRESKAQSLYSDGAGAAWGVEPKTHTQRYPWVVGRQSSQIAALWCWRGADPPKERESDAHGWTGTFFIQKRPKVGLMVLKRVDSAENNIPTNSWVVGSFFLFKRGVKAA